MLEVAALQTGIHGSMLNVHDTRALSLITEVLEKLRFLVKPVLDFRSLLSKNKPLDDMLGISFSPM